MSFEMVFLFIGLVHQTHPHFFKSNLDNLKNVANQIFRLSSEKTTLIFVFWQPFRGPDGIN